ncbi:hypothetical protein F4782DRAFT_181966 [Xylaria castorea]|nr:hypothetical protein F4782DRAFT_181966 [Xylaria castorea]
MVNDTHGRSQYPSRPANWYPGRMGAEPYSEDGRFAESPEMRGRPWTINRGLTEACGIPGRTFFVAAEENGKVICLSTPYGSSQLDHGVFFDQDAFIRESNRVQQADNQSFDELQRRFSTGMSMGILEADRTRIRDRRHYPKSTVEVSANDAARRSKKRPRTGSNHRGLDNIKQENMPMAAMPPRKGIRIGDTAAVYAFYDHRLRSCQQTACKTIAKAWVKAIAPKKQSIHPYTGGDVTRPDWWPKTYHRFGEDTDKPLRHKEPDHLGKEERIFLLCHILHMLVEPVHNQHPAIRKVELDLDILEAATFEALSSWFNDRDTPANGEKKLLLKEIFKVAKQEARFKDGGLDGNTEVFVKAFSSDEACQGGASDSDDERGFDEIFTPDSSMEPSKPRMMMSQVQVHEHGETGHFAGNSFAENIPMCTPHYSNPGFEPELSERPNYIEASGMGTHIPNYGHSHLGLPEMYPSPQETSRRSSVFHSPAEYGSPATPVVYSPWSSSNTPGNAPIYGFQSQPHGVQAFGGQMAQGPSYAASSIDGLPRPGTEAHHGDIFASRSVGQGAVHHQSGYPNYVTDSASLVVKTEEGLPPSLPQ